MSAFEPGREHKFAFGLRGFPDRAPLGLEADAPIEPWEFVYQLGDVGAWGVAVHDDDLVPGAASAAERDDILDKFTKALDSTGVVVSIVRTKLGGHSVFAHGSFTAVDRDVRRYSIQKAMRAIDLGAELGAERHDLPCVRDALAAPASTTPLDALARYQEAVDFLCGYVREQRYPTRFALPSTAHALAFIATLDRPELVGLEVAHRADVASGGCHAAAHAIAAGKLLSVDVDAHPTGVQDPDAGVVGLNDTFALVKLLEDSGYDGPRHFAVDRRLVADSDEIGDFATGCMRTYRALAAKARRFVDDPEIRDALVECGATELAERSVGVFSPDAGRALSIEGFDPAAMAGRRYRSQRLDQLVTDLVLGLR